VGLGLKAEHYRTIIGTGAHIGFFARARLIVHAFEAAKRSPGAQLRIRRVAGEVDTLRT